MDSWRPAGAPIQGGGHQSSVWSALVRHPELALTLLCLTQILCWTIMPALVTSAPPGDVVEGFMWGREWVLLTYKHPQLPAWLLETSHLLTGSFRWPQYLLAQLVVSSTFVFVYLLGRDMVGRTRALAAVLLMPSIYFFGWPTPQFNHDFAQMPFWAAISWLLWRATRGNGALWWVALGLVSGVGLYAKFSTGLLLVFGALWLLCDARARSRLATPWPWLGFAVFLGVAAPLVMELFRIDFLPLTYVAGRDGWVLAHRARLYYIGVQLAGLAGFLAVLAISGLLRRPSPDEPVSQEAPVEPRAFTYLLWMGLGPAGLVMVASLFTGAGEAWGAPMYNLIGLVAVAGLGKRLGVSEMRRLAICAAVCIVGMSSAYAAIRSASCNVFGHMVSVCWPAQLMSEQAETVWHENVKGPLGIVGGDSGLAMLAGLNAYDKPSIFTGLDMRFAPWITPKRLQEQGMLLVWQGSEEPPRRLVPWIKTFPVKTVLLDWSRQAPPLAINFVVIPPGTSDLPSGPPAEPEE
ncbi:glycosyltransferase family 39 protein [Mesorhizobium sp. INR15]|nr:glycosyltransferase family 39 protein [Mesorhizobium sp. INR15]